MASLGILLHLEHTCLAVLSTLLAQIKEVLT